MDVYLDQLHVRGKNLTNSADVSQSLFGQIHVQARAMKSGELKIDVDIWVTLGSIFKNMFSAPISPNVEHSVKLKDVKK